MQAEPGKQADQDKKAGLTSDGGQWGYKEGQGANLPRVLLIGDSILIGYYPRTAGQLQGRAKVDRFSTGLNIGLGKPLYDQLDAALALGPYDIIHFNDMGLHAWQKGRIPEGQYEPLLRKYVETIRQANPNAILIWANTTPITVKGQPGQLDETDAIIVERNAIAARVMAELGIETDDLYGLMAQNLDTARGDQFHWNPKGQKLQAEQVAASVEAALQKLPPASASNP